jgi:hypothetical protein
MRRPEIAGVRKRSRDRLRLKKGPGMPRPRRRRPARLPLATPEVPAAAGAPQSSAARANAEIAPAEAVAREPLRCCFGAVRVGALLGRVRLHLQTDRFLAVHRGDALWEEGCVGAACALAEIAARISEGEFNAPLARDPEGRCSATAQIKASGLPPSEPAGRPELQEFRTELRKASGMRKIGAATLARCGAELERCGR